VKAVTADVAQRAERLAAIERVHALRRVLDHHQPTSLRDLADAIHFAGDAGVMNGDDHSCSLGDGRLNQILVEVERVRTDVDKDGPRTGPHERARRRDERERGQNHLVAGLEIAQERGHLEGGRARRREQDAVDAQPLFQQSAAGLREATVAG